MTLSRYIKILLYFINVLINLSRRADSC